MRLRKFARVVTAMAVVAVLFIVAALSVNSMVSATTAADNASGRGSADSLPTVALPPELDRVLRDYERAWAAGDEAALAALFTEDALLMPSAFPEVRGRQAIQQKSEDVIVPVRLRALAYAADDSAGYVVGAYRYETLDYEQGKFAFALRRAPGGPWMIAAEIENVSHIQDPEPQAQPAR